MPLQQPHQHSRDIIEDDDFETEVKREAQRYNAQRKNETEREHLKSENKRRRKQGLDMLKVPKLIKLEEASSASDGSEQTEHSSSGSNRNAIDSRKLGHAGAKKGKKRKKGLGNDNLSYEGQVILPYNPLYRLAGLQEHHKLPNTELAYSSNPSEELKSTASWSREGDLRYDGKYRGSLEDIDFEYEDEVIVPGDSSFLEHISLLDKPEVSAGYSEDEIFEETTDLGSHSTASDQPTRMTGRPEAERKPDFSQHSQLCHPSSLQLDADHPGIAVPGPVNCYLKEFQREGVRFLYRKYREGRGGVLGDDMGLGKTVQVISFLSAIMRKTGMSNDIERRKNLIRSTDMNLSPKHWPTALIICPKFLIRNWQRELITWGYFEYSVWQSDTAESVRSQFMNGYLDLILISYETSRNYIEQLKDMPFSTVIVDEAHRLKEPRAAITLALKKIVCPSCFALTGTILQNSIAEIWSVLDFVDRGHAGTLHEWREFAVNPIKKGHRHEGSAKDVVTGIMRLGVMYKKVLPYFYLRRDKRLIAHELPEKRDLVVYCPLAKRQVVAYQALIVSEDVRFILSRNDPCDCGSEKRRSKCCHALNAHGESITEVILKNINALSKVANHFGLLYHAKDDTPATRVVNQKLFRICTGEDYDGKQQDAIKAALDPANCGKWKLLSDLLRSWREDVTRNKVLIFSNSVRLLKMIAEFIATTFSGFAFDMITGEVGIDDRMDMVDRFQDPAEDQFILLISTMAGGVGLNLTAANKVVIFDPAWNPANDLQAMDRAFRIGQQRPVDVYRLIGQGTLEELMYERQIHKQQKARQLNQGTFESRIHQGYEGATKPEDQGELFGTQNIFKFDPEGFVPGRLERVRIAEDRFVQDLIDAEYKNDDDADREDSEDDTGREMREERKSRAERRAQDTTSKRRNDDIVIDTVLGHEKDVRQEDNILKSLGISSHVHDSAFRDSPEEASMFQIGLSLLRSNPDFAAKVKANDLGKLGRPTKLTGNTKTPAELASGSNSEQEPWKNRIHKARDKARGIVALAELSD